MPSYEYKGHQFESDHELSAEEWKQTLAYFDAQPAPKKTTNLLDKFKTEASGFGAGTLSAVKDTSRNIALGTIGLPSLGVDKAIQAITGNEDYANPVTQYVGSLVESSENARRQVQEQEKASELGGVGTIVGSVAGKVPEMLMGGMGSAGMKTIQPVAGAIMPSIQQMAQQGFAAAQPLAVSAGLGRYGEALDKGHTGTEAAAAGLGAYGNMAMQGTLPMGMPGSVGKRIATGAAVNVPAGIAGRQLENVTSPADMQYNLYDPKAMATDALMGSVLHGTLGKNPNVKQQKPNTKLPETKLSPEQDFTPKPNGAPSTGVLHQIGVARTYAENGLKSATKARSDLMEILPDNASNLDLQVKIKELDEIIAKYENDIAEADKILKNPDKPIDDTTGQQIVDMQRQYDRIAEAKAGRPPRTRAREASPAEEVPLDVYGDAPARDRAEVDMETGEILSQPRPDVPARTEPKQSPYEIAVTKIGEAMNEPKEKVAGRLQRAQEALAAITGRVGRADTPGSDYSALKAALEHEISGYESILRGEQPKLEEASVKSEYDSLLAIPKEERTPEMQARLRELGQERLKQLEKESIDKFGTGKEDEEPRPLAAPRKIVEEDLGNQYDLFGASPELQLQEHNILRRMDNNVEAYNREEAGFTLEEALEKGIITPEKYTQLKNHTRDISVDQINTLLSGDKAPKDTKPQTPKQLYQRAKFELEKLDRLEANIRNKIEQDAQGLLPSGSVDHGALQRSLESIAEQREKWEKIQKWAIDNTGVVQKEGQFAKTATDVEMEVAPVKYDSIDDIIAAHQEDNKSGKDDSAVTAKQLEAFIDNPQLFDNTPGTDIHFDKRLAEIISPEFIKMISHLLKVTRLGKEKIYFIADTVTRRADGSGKSIGGRASLSGNSVVVRFNPDDILYRLAEAGKKTDLFTKFLGTESSIRKVMEDYSILRIVAHELGHVSLIKYLRDTITHKDDLQRIADDWQQRRKLKGFGISIADIGIEKKRDAYQAAFHEFFAERVARNLMLKHVLGAFDNKTSGYLTDIKKIVDASIQYLVKNRFVSFDKDKFADIIYADIINGTQEYIKQTSAEAEHRITLLQNDKAILAYKAADPDAFPFYKETFEGVRDKHLDMNYPDMFAGNSKALDMAANTGPDLSTRAATKLGHGLARNLFAKTTLSKIFRNNPIIQETHKIIRDAELEADRVNNKLWFGETLRATWDAAKPWQKMSKIKAEASAYWQLKNASNLDAHAVHGVFKKGFEEEIPYAKNLADNGSHLTSKQKKLFETLATLFKNQYDEIVRIQERLGRTEDRILPFREGWYPSVRTGEYYVDIGFRGNTTHRQHFRSKVEANAFLEKLSPQTRRFLDVSDVMEVDREAPGSNFLDGIEKAQQIIMQKFPASASPVTRAIREAMENITSTGGKLGGHHNFRSNLAGYRGSELFANPNDRGSSFKRAIQHSVTEYSGGIRKMIINSKADTLLDYSGTPMSDETRATARQMFDSALNRMPKNALEGVDKGIQETWDRAVKHFTGEIRADSKDSFNSVYGNVLEAFYLTKLMSKIVFPIGQVLTAASAIREMSHEGGYVRPYISFARGIGKLVTNNKDLKDILFKVSQETNTFEPQFIEALHLGDNESKLVDNIKTYALLNKVNQAADSLSRVIVFTSMLDMYQSMGVSRKAAIRKAIDNTNATMVAYGSTEAAPIFGKLGIAGTAMRPLQTYGQAQLGNWISDFRALKAQNPKTWAPMLNYTLVATALGGALSPLFMQEYELIRHFMEVVAPDYAPPAILDLAKGVNGFFDGVSEDPNAVTKAVQYGIPSAVAGIDLASATRSNMTFLTTIGAVITAQEDWTKLFPALGFIGDTIGGAATLGMATVNPNISNAQKRTAASQALPAGAISYGARDLMGVNTTKILGQEAGQPMVAGGAANEAVTPMTWRERTAGYMGTKSTAEKFATDQSRLVNEREKNLKQRVNKLYDLLAESPNSPALVKKRYDKLIELGETDKTIDSRLDSEMFKRQAGAIRRILETSRGIPDTPATERKAKQIFNFRGAQNGM